MTKIYPIDALTDSQIQEVAQSLQAGAVAAFATDTVYGLGTSAFDEKAIEHIYQVKQRPTSMPLQILVDSITKAKQIVQCNEAAIELANAYWPGALTLIMPANETGKVLLRGFAGLGVRVPNYPVLQQILKQMAVPLASTSANVHGQPVWTRQEEVVLHLNGKVDYILTGGTLQAVASSVVDVMAAPRLLREGSISRKQLAAVLATPLK